MVKRTHNWSMIQQGDESQKYDIPKRNFFNTLHKVRKRGKEDT